MAGKLQQIVGHAIRTQDRRTADAKPFAKRHYEQLRFHLLSRARTAPFLTAYANPMRIIHQQPRALPFRHRVDFCQRRTVAIHAEHAFGDHQLLPRTGGCQQTIQMLRVVMGKAT